MASIASIIKSGKGKAGSNASWQAFTLEDGSLELWHYSTRMLHVSVDGELLHADTGHGSVSDQGAMNQAFRILGLPFRFDRDQRGGGPRITDISEQLAAYGY